MRRDAEANRAKLVLVGRQLMQDQGGDVPVEHFCKAAGVTRGTFYRNFTDRASLYEAVLEHELDAVKAALDVPDLDPLAFLRHLVEMMMVYDKFLAALPDMADYRPDGVSQAKIVAAIEPGLHHAQRLGVLSARLTGTEVMIACRMVACDWRLDRLPNREEAVTLRMDLMMRGLAGR